MTSQIESRSRSSFSTPPEISQTRGVTTYALRDLQLEVISCSKDGLLSRLFQKALVYLQYLWGTNLLSQEPLQQTLDIMVKAASQISFSKKDLFDCSPQEQLRLAKAHHVFNRAMTLCARFVIAKSHVDRLSFTSYDVLLQETKETFTKKMELLNASSNIDPSFKLLEATVDQDLFKMSLAHFLSFVDSDQAEVGTDRKKTFVSQWLERHLLRSVVALWDQGKTQAPDLESDLATQHHNRQVKGLLQLLEKLDPDPTLYAQEKELLYLSLSPAAMDLTLFEKMGTPFPDLQKKWAICHMPSVHARLCFLKESVDRGSLGKQEDQLKRRLHKELEETKRALKSSEAFYQDLQKAQSPKGKYSQGIALMVDQASAAVRAHQKKIEKIDSYLQQLSFHPTFSIEIRRHLEIEKLEALLLACQPLLPDEETQINMFRDFGLSVKL